MYTARARQGEIGFEFSPNCIASHSAALRGADPSLKFGTYVPQVGCDGRTLPDGSELFFETGEDVEARSVSEDSGVSGGVALPDPLELVRGLLSCSVDVKDAVQLVSQYYSATGGSVPGSVRAGSDRVSRVSVRQWAREQAWHDRVRAMPAVQGQCYLHPVRWGRRDAYLRKLGSAPSFRDFVAMLEPGDLCVPVAKQYCLYQLDLCGPGVDGRVVYHIDEPGYAEGVCVGTVYDCVAAVLRLYPFVNTVYKCDTGGVEKIPLVGVVGWLPSQYAGRTSRSSFGVGQVVVGDGHDGAVAFARTTSAAADPWQVDFAQYDGHVRLDGVDDGLASDGEYESLGGLVDETDSDSDDGGPDGVDRYLREFASRLERAVYSRRSGLGAMGLRPFGESAVPLDRGGAALGTSDFAGTHWGCVEHLLASPGLALDELFSSLAWGARDVVLVAGTGEYIPGATGRVYALAQDTCVVLSNGVEVSASDRAVELLVRDDVNVVRYAGCRELVSVPLNSSLFSDMLSHVGVGLDSAVYVRALRVRDDWAVTPVACAEVHGTGLGDGYTRTLELCGASLRYDSYGGTGCEERVSLVARGGSMKMGSLVVPPLLPVLVLERGGGVDVIVEPLRVDVSLTFSTARDSRGGYDLPQLEMD